MTAYTFPTHDPTNTVPRGPSAISRAFVMLSANTVTSNPAGTTHWLAVCARRHPEAVRAERRMTLERAVIGEGLETIGESSSAEANLLNSSRNQLTAYGADSLLGATVHAGRFSFQ